jgi:hypothetical protein
MFSALEVFAYYFPNYHADARNNKTHGERWDEWDLVKAAKPRFPNHQQPKTPLWGYEDEADSRVMARKIDAAADHGLSGFLFDWYFYDDGPFLERALDEGFLNAPNSERLKFALMWANHDWVDIHPAAYGSTPALLYPGAVTRQTFERIVELVIEKYFRHPSYWKIDGCPYFSIYEMMTLIKGLGGVEATRDALEHFRAQTKAAGFPDLHLNAVVWGVQILPNEQKIQNPNELLAALGLDSVASYVWLHHVWPKEFPFESYETVMDQATQHWRKARDDNTLPYIPNVTMGWDASPRTQQDAPFENKGYPFMPVLEGNTPALFEHALSQAKTFVNEDPKGLAVITINAWNEWTEGSYLEPDTTHGMEYLKSIRRIFGAA